MANFTDKVKVTAAAEGNWKKDLSSTHISTTDFFEYNIAYNKRMKPKDRFVGKMGTFARALTLARPTFGDIQFHNRAYFVPYRTIFKGWNDFSVDTAHVYANITTPTNATTISTVPIVNNGVLKSALHNSFFMTTTGASATHYDILATDSQGNVSYYLLTAVGRQAMKILQSLGYNICWSGSVSKNFSMLPLLAAAKIYMDWYFPSDYAETGVFTYIKSYFVYDGAQGKVFTQQEITTILTMICYTTYESDYFTSAWDNPVAPNTGLYSEIIFNDITEFSVRSQASSGSVSTGVTTKIRNTSIGASTEENTRQGNTKGTPFIETSTGATSGNPSVKPITQYAIDTLKSMTDYIKRHQLVGSRVTDRYLAEYGIELNSDKTDRSMKIAQINVPVQIGDVMSTADTAGLTSGAPGAALGEYAGKAIGWREDQQRLNIDFTTTEWGELIVISSLIPKVGYYQGIDRNVLDISKLDFETPEFDNLGVQAISAAEIYIPEEGNSPINAGIFDAVFGFTTRYGHTKVGHDRLTGDYRVKTLRNNGAEDAWYMMRDIKGIFSTATQASDIVHSLNFLRAFNDADQFKRIFLNGNTNEDMFKVIYTMNCAVYGWDKPMWDSYEFDSNGKDVIEQWGGSKEN